MALLSLFNSEGVPITTSLPRDCLQAERSALLLCKFGAVLCLLSFAVVLDFRLNTGDDSGDGDGNDGGSGGDDGLGPVNRDVFAMVIGTIFFVLSICSLTLGLYNYFHSIRLYLTQHRSVVKKMPINLFVSILVVTLLSLNIALLVDMY